MIVEERIYRIRNGCMSLYLNLVRTEGLAIQQPILGHLVGYFTTEIGVLSQVTHLWAYPSLDERARRRARLAQDKRWQAFIPRPTIGGSYNTGGRTSYAYLGATWTIEVFPETLGRKIFIDGFFGGAAHNGYTGPKVTTPYGFNTLGCSPLFREAAAIGYRLTEHWSIMATVEHMSNAGLCANNRGLTNYGGKIGYTF